MRKNSLFYEKKPFFLYDAKNAAFSLQPASICLREIFTKRSVEFATVQSDLPLGIPKGDACVVKRSKSKALLTLNYYNRFCVLEDYSYLCRCITFYYSLQ